MSMNSEIEALVMAVAVAGKRVQETRAQLDVRRQAASEAQELLDDAYNTKRVAECALSAAIAKLDVPS